MKFLLLAVLALSLAFPPLAQAQARRAQVYRCGPDGRDLRDSPCPGGNAASSSESDDVDEKTSRERHLAEARRTAAAAQARYAREAEARHQRSQSYGLQEQQAASTPAGQKPAQPARPAASAAGR